MVRDIVIVGSSALMLPYADIAAFLYTGKTFRAALRYARSQALDQNIMVLSPRYGLLSLHDRAEPYSVAWRDAEAIRKSTLLSQISKGYPQRLRFLMLCSTPQATLLLDAYREVKGQHAHFEAPLMEMGQSYHLEWLKRNYTPNPAIMNDPDNIKADGGRRIKLRAVASSLADAQFIADGWRQLYAGQLLYSIEPRQEKSGDWLVYAIVLMNISHSLSDAEALLDYDGPVFVEGYQDEKGDFEPEPRQSQATQAATGPPQSPQMPPGSPQSGTVATHSPNEASAP